VKLFENLAHAHGVRFEKDWTTEQIADALIKADVPWPEQMTNEQGWQLWTAKLRAEGRVKSAVWSETKSGEIGVVFRLQDRREFRYSIDQEMLKTHHFGAICKMLEVRLLKWKRAR
jgi:hypothetical protein